MTWDHPRMCGEHRVLPGGHHEPDGIIPACAGSTLPTTWRPLPTRDHPRMCGEHSAVPFGAIVRRGSSPHVRGARVDVHVSRTHVGIIPACAGSTPRRCPRPPAGWDHPRMCGEHLVVNAKKATDKGSSPHVRGAHRDQQPDCVQPGIIPACAGSTRGSSAGLELCRDHPRMCGEHSCRTSDWLGRQGSSPHVRGAPSRQSPTEPPTRDHPRMCGEH